MKMTLSRGGFYGWRVAQGAFVLGAFGWGIGFFGPPVFLVAKLQVMEGALTTISAAVSLHFLVGALTGASLPGLHRRFGRAAAVKAGASLLAAGLAAWALAASALQLFFAACLTGAGWGAMSAAALNLIVAPWFVRARPAALALAYNGGSVGGIVFAPLWVTAIGALGFPSAAALIGAAMLLSIWIVADRVFARTPQAMGLEPDGDSGDAGRPRVTSSRARPLKGSSLWRERAFLLLAAGMTLGLFAQIGLVAHLFSLLAPVLGAQRAGWAMALITVMAIAGRTLTGALLSPGADRSRFACIGYVAQLAGSIAFIVAAGSDPVWLVAGIVLFGIGFGNATSLPPLIAHVEFVEADVQRVTALVVGIAQTGYAFAPAAFGWMRTICSGAGVGMGEAAGIFAMAALLQALAAALFLRLSLRSTRARGRWRAALLS